MNISFFGAAPDTGNLGVTALCYATLYGLQLVMNHTKITVFDHGRGSRKESVMFPQGKVIFNLQGAVNSRRFYRPENLMMIKLFSKLGFNFHDVTKTITESSVVLDISGGDSFTDLYGLRRFNTVALPKEITINKKVPLVLLPQTYGPFKTRKCRERASWILKRTMSSWARDTRSYEVLKDLLGSDFDPQKHRSGVDVAFGLPVMKPNSSSSELLTALKSNIAKVGINVSGLIYNDEERAKNDFGFKADYREIVYQLVKRFLSETDAHIFLVPHVITQKGHYESDEDACYSLITKFSQSEQQRIMVVQAFSNPCEIKWVINQFDWFCGTRMHAAIAALSSAVPVSAISYSPKTLGVFETCGQGKHVADPVKYDTGDVIEILWSSWLKRREARHVYKKFLPNVQKTLKDQFVSILNVARGE